jgi:hypothetical protein|tara:strand:- start:3543 stop:3995 length:453 start_codon:yes stop_codon:yes gene_type:complete
LCSGQLGSVLLASKMFGFRWFGPPGTSVLLAKMFGFRSRGSGKYEQLFFESGCSCQGSQLLARLKYEQLFGLKPAAPGCLQQIGARFGESGIQWYVFSTSAPFSAALPGAGTSIYEQLFAFLAGKPAARSNPNIFSSGAVQHSQIYDTEK